MIYMKETIDENELSFPVNIWEKILYHNVHELQLDIYYNETGFPAKLHDLYGASEINKYRLVLINEICKRNNTNDIWRVSGDAFAVISKKTNCGNFNIKYKDLTLYILKKTVIIRDCL